MSFSLFMLRLLTVETLKGQTYAGLRVLDAPLDPVSILDEEAKPLIAVYTSECKGNVTGHDLIGADTSVELIIQILLPSTVRLDQNGTGLGIEVRDSGSAALHDMISGQILRALQITQTPWADLWREFALPLSGAKESLDLTLSPIVFDLSDSLRFPAFEVRLSVRPLSDPLPLEPLPEIWHRAFALLRQNPEHAALADWCEGALSAGSETSYEEEWALAARVLGLSTAQGVALGFPSCS